MHGSGSGQPSLSVRPMPCGSVTPTGLGVPAIVRRSMLGPRKWVSPPSVPQIEAGPSRYTKTSAASPHGERDYQTESGAAYAVLKLMSDAGDSAPGNALNVLETLRLERRCIGDTSCRQ